MKFVRLRLSGFKSFVDPTELLIEPGLTGVVGPNGCGKSNLLEALRWVMGETSYKTLRGSAMDDVIFSGAADRPARNSAEVTVTLDNSGRTAPAQFNNDDVIEVSRRIEREAGSAYRINSREARARDVQMLFADAATGAHSIALVRQGQIGEIISAKPQARRAILEEAAGISGLHHRRHEAELRLRAAEQNLGRLDDVIGEIDNQLQTLRRQARQAQKYRRVAAEIRQSEALMLHLRWSEAGAALEAARGERSAGADRARDLTGSAAAAATAESAASETIAPRRQAEAEAAAALQRLRSEDRSLASEAERAMERGRDLTARRTQIAADLAREQANLADHAAQIDALDREEAELKSMLEASVSSREAARIEVAEAAEALAGADAALAARTGALIELKGAHSSASARRADCAARLARLEREAAEIAEKIARCSGSEEADALAAEAALTAAAGRLAETEQAAGARAQALAEARSGETAARETMAEAERILDRLQTEAAALRQVIGKPEESTGKIVDRVTVEPGYESALVAALGDDLDASTMPDATMRWRELEPMAAWEGLPEGAEPLGQFVSAPPELERRLAYCGVVEAGDGELLQRRLLPGQRLVSREGDLWRWDGFVARAGAGTAASKRLAARNRLEAIGLKLDGARDQMEALKVAHGAERGRLAQAERDEREAREAWRQASQDVSRVRSALAAIETKARAQREAMAGLEQRKTRVEADLAESREALASAGAALAALAPLGALEAEIEPLRGAVAGAREAFGRAEARAQALEREAIEAARRRERIAADVQRWRDRVVDSERQEAALGERLAETEADLVKLTDIPDAIAEKRARLAEAVGEAETARRIAADRLAEAESRLAELHQATRRLEADLGEARESLARAEARQEAAEERRTASEQAIADELGCPPAEAFALAGLEPGADIPDLAGVETRVQRAREERERLGAVNLRAEDEAREQEERAGELKAERDDLDKAIRRLRQGIGVLNSEARGRLRDAFETVNSQFGALFKTLFGGGTAELQLTESDDPLEAGLEVIARPPGKRPQTLTLLSGGEQTLTAFALMLAVFRTNPSPICVLDEVDAPLDDANVERFCNLVSALAGELETRFLVITHHPYTMSRMDRLFGVTMAERGVSKLVSVELDHAERLREAG